MDNHTQDFARQIISRLDAIKRLILDAIALNSQKGERGQKQIDQNEGHSDSIGNRTPVEFHPSPPAQVTPRSHRWIRRHKPLIELLGAVVLTIYTAVTIALWGSSKEANGTAIRALSDNNKNFVTGERPYVWIANGKTGAPGIVKLLDKAQFVQMIWTVSLSNFGKTPAYKLNGTRFIQVGSHSRVSSYGEAIDVPTLIPPTGEVITTTISPPDIRETEIKAILARGSTEKITIWGDYTYRDSHGNLYETHYCLSRLNTGSISYCEGNDIR
jgi:hypothetical protein